MKDQALVTTKTIEDMMDGVLPWSETHRIMSSFKDADRFDKYVSVLQSRVSWDNQIILPLTPHLFIVKKENEYIVKCTCSHEFGDYRKNWKTKALIYVRDTEEKLEAVWRGPRQPDPEKNEVREFYCPGCATQLEVDAVPPGYPILINFLPDLEAFYEEWLDRPLP